MVGHSDLITKKGKTLNNVETSLNFGLKNWLTEANLNGNYKKIMINIASTMSFWFRCAQICPPLIAMWLDWSVPLDIATPTPI